MESSLDEMFQASKFYCIISERSGSTKWEGEASCFWREGVYDDHQCKSLRSSRLRSITTAAMRAGPWRSIAV